MSNKPNYASIFHYKQNEEEGAKLRKHESQSEAHRLFREVPGHGARGSKFYGKDGKPHPPGVVPPGATGVIYVTNRAAANGFSTSDPEWANFGQGAPEVGRIEGESPRPEVIDLKALGEDVNEYAPTTGDRQLRDAVANLYNDFYRKGKSSQYTYENVCIVPGGRAGLARIAAVIGNVFVNYQVPDYSAYQDLLSCFKTLVPIPTILSAEDAYHINIDKLANSIRDQGFSVVLASNPRNPTGQYLSPEDLEKMCELARLGTTQLLDEFYSAYIYDREEGTNMSAAEYVEDVNVDSVVLVNGLTKCWRLPGWRVCWVIGPKQLINALGEAGSFIEGGASHVLQKAAIPMLDPDWVRHDNKVLQRHFKKKRDYVLDRLQTMGFVMRNPPTSTFYIWLDLSGLPSPLDSGLVLFEELLKEKVIVVPGIFFDLNPSHRRNIFDSPAEHFIRLSYGPSMDHLEKGLDGIERLLKRVYEVVKAGKNPHDHFGKNLADHKQ